MNLPNKLSLLRVLLIPVMVLLMYIPGVLCVFLSTAVFGIAAFTDFLDGHIARKYNLVTDFGKFIDPVADKLLNLSAMIMLIHCGMMPAWVVIIILARELAVDGLRMVAVGQGRVIAAGPLGKIKTASQMVVIIFMMLICRLTPAIPALSFLQLPVDIIRWAGILWIAVITAWSGIDYFVRNFDCIRNAK
ncbi:MAG: CDP-diacylglycerol--glycerol-3-phosphate 3-phosphatidyltransferase [Clostridia bacterium]|nr:CDP-diacylglycerol--glycerol-3-phosphate 3-phosphatidyltransferase [Clostridia bacterium]